MVNRSSDCYPEIMKNEGLLLEEGERTKNKHSWFYKKLS
jgi:hypothetical protein